MQNPVDVILFFPLFTDPEMQGHIEKIIYQGHSSFKIFQSVCL